MDRVVAAQTPMRFFDPHLDATSLFVEADTKPALLRHLMGELTHKWDVRTDAPWAHTPFLLIHGRYDYAVPYSLWSGVTEQLPTATLRIFDRSGHHPFFEEPQAFTRAVADWMGRLP